MNWLENATVLREIDGFRGRDMGIYLKTMGRMVKEKCENSLHNFFNFPVTCNLVHGGTAHKMSQPPGENFSSYAFLALTNILVGHGQLGAEQIRY